MTGPEQLKEPFEREGKVRVPVVGSGPGDMGWGRETRSDFR